jgi:hypothetical protein
MNQYMIAGLILLASHSAAFYVGIRHEQNIQLREDAIVRKVQDAATTKAAEAIAGITTTNTTINNRVREIIKTELVYSECRHSAEAFQKIKEAY